MNKCENKKCKSGKKADFVAVLNDQIKLNPDHGFTNKYLCEDCYNNLNKGYRNVKN